MSNLDEILIEHGKVLRKLANLMKNNGDGLSKAQAKEVADVIDKSADNIFKLAKKVYGE